MFDLLLSTATSATSLAVFAISLLVVYGIKSWLRHPADQPPMPCLPFPITGHSTFLKPSPSVALHGWRKRVGDIFTIYLAGEPNVVINSYRLLHEALVKKADHFSDRPVTVRHKLVPDTISVGIVGNSGESWKQNRSVSMSILRDFGMGKNLMAQRISEEVSVFVRKLDELKGEARDITLLLNSSISNVICAVLLGERFDYDDQVFKKLIVQNGLLMRLVPPSSMLIPFPFLRFLPGDLFDAKLLERVIEELQALFSRRFIKKFVDTKDDTESDNFIKAYLREMHARQQSGKKSHLNHKNLQHTLSNLFVAGTETTSTTILWAIVFALRCPDVQQKLYNEIKEVVGTDRVPELEDKPRMNYVNAFIMETQRLGAISPLSLAHLCSQTTEVGGFTIPKGAVILPNLDEVLKDPQHWTHPHEFRPERFLDEDNKLISYSEFLPFSLGRRVCLGASLAKMELFLFLTAMFQRFELRPEVANTHPSTDIVFGLTASPKPFRVRFKRRNN